MANIIKGMLIKNKLLFVSISGFLLICAITYVIYSQYAKNQIKENFLNDLVLKTGTAESVINRSLNQNKNNTRFLYSTPPVKGIARALNNNNVDPLDGTTTAQWTKRLEIIFSAFIFNNPDIRQIRYISKLNQGRELVRVEKRDNKVIVTPTALLQSKQDSNYYQTIQHLNISEIYISDISLNREYGILENPLWPTYRIAQTVFDENYNFFGFIILNIDASPLLTQLQNEFSKSKFDFYLLNTDGYFISAKKEALTFGFDLDNSNAIWSQLSNANEIPIDKKVEQLNFEQIPYYMYGTKLTLSQREARYLHVLGGLPVNNIEQLWQQQSKFVILIFLFLFSIVIVVTLYYQRHLNKIWSLYDNQSRYEAIISGSSDAIINIDVTGKVLSWNETATYLFGINKEFAFSKNVNEIIGITETEFLLTEKRLTNIINQRKASSYEVVNNTDKDNITYLSVNLSPVIPHKDSTPASVSILIRDITESKLNEYKIINNNEILELEVTQRTKELKLATAEAVSANQSKSAFVANISHEIRTPLNGISGMLELIIKEPLTEKQTNYIKLAKTSISNLTMLINDLLNLTKMESGKLDIELNEFNIIKTISSVIETMFIKSSEKGLNLSFDWSKVQQEIVVSDDYRFKQVLVNLISNAIKFTDKGSIIVSAETKLNNTNSKLVDCIVSVKDNGIGITKEQQKKLFQPFIQATSSTDKEFGGTGLGLSISKKLVELLGGTINIQSEVNNGSTFTFSIQSKLISTQSTPLFSPKLFDKKILLISENRATYNSVLKQLRRWKAEAYLLNTQEADLRIHRSMPPSLLLIDSEVMNNTGQQWIKHCQSVNDCKLVILQNCQYPLLKKDEYSDNIFIEPPILPYQLLNIIESTFNIGLSPVHTPKLIDTSEKFVKHSILVVDDNEINQIVAAGLLEPLSVDIQTASNGQEAIDILNNSNNQFDLILMDCQMPILDGFQATRLIRQGNGGECNSQITIVAMTAGAMSGSKDACIQAGMDDFIIKPLDADLFRNKISNWLEKNGNKNNIVKVV